MKRDRVSLARLLDREEEHLDRTDFEQRFGGRLTIPRLRRRIRRAGSEDRESLRGLIGEIPNFLKLLYRLAIDARVSRFDKGVLLATIGYILLPMDLVPDLVPFLGQVDDLYLLALALNRLLTHAGADVLREHWDGQLDALETALDALDRAGSLLPDRVRSLLDRKFDHR